MILDQLSTGLASGELVVIVDRYSAPPKANELLSVTGPGNNNTELSPPVENKYKTIENYILVKIYPGGSSHKQYVNLSSNSDDKSHGRNIEFEAHLDKPISGVTVYFRLIGHDKNKVGLPTRIQSKGLSSSMKEDSSVMSATTNAYGIARINMKLSTFGGDKFQGVASLDSKCVPEAKENVKSTWITIWRKLWYQLTLHKDLTPPSMSNAINQFKKVFIDFEAEGNVKHNKAPIGKVVVGSHNAVDYHDLHNNLHPGQSVHIILCDEQIDGTPGIETESVSEFTNNSNYIHVTDGEDYVMFNPPLSGGEFFISGSWINPSSNKSGALTDQVQKKTDDIGLFSYFNKDFVKVELPKNANPSKENPVKVVIKVTVASGPWGGDGGTAPHNLIVIDPDDTIHTMCVMHELGHLMNLGPMEYSVKCPDGFEYSDHPNLYASNGAHCYSGGKPGTDSRGNKIGIDGTCIMYHQLNTSCSLEFCSYCAPFVKGMKLKKFKDLSK